MNPPFGKAVAAFAAVAVVADLSPLAKLDPSSGLFAAALHDGREGVAQTLYVALVIATLGAPLALGLAAARTPRRLLAGRRGTIVSLSVVLAMFAVVTFMLPRNEGLHAIGRGSDQAACILVPARRLAHLQWPYDRTQIWSGNPCSAGVGWIALAAPFVVVLRSYAAFLVAGATALSLALRGRAAATALLLVGSCLAAWQAMATGADTLAVGFALAALTHLSLRPKLAVGVAIASGLLATARLPFVFIPGALGLFAFARGERRAALTLAGLGSATALLAHGMALAWNGASYVADGPFDVMEKSAAYARGAGSAFFVIAAVAGTVVAVRGAARPSSASELQLRVGTLALLAVAGAAASDLVHYVGSASDLHDAWRSLQLWRGANWLMVALPSFAASVAASLGEDEPSAQFVAQ